MIFFLRCKPLVAGLTCMKPNPAGLFSQLVESLLDLAEASGKAADKWAPKDSLIIDLIDIDMCFD